MKCVVSGATGFIGSNLVHHLSVYGWNVLKIGRNDFASFETLQAAVAGHKPQVAFHLAGMFDESDEWSTQNLIANFNCGFLLAAACRTIKNCRMINVSSYWEYADPPSAIANTVYAALKSSFRHFLTALPPQEQIPHISVVLFDVYGPGDARKKLISKLTNPIASQEPLALTEGEQLLDLCCIADVCHGLRIAATSGFEDGQTRALSGHRVSLRKMVDMAQNLRGQKLTIEWGGISYPARQIFKPIDSLLPVKGWSPQIDLNEGLQKCLNP